jgi:hypothetical protein
MSEQPGTPQDEQPGAPQDQRADPESRRLVADEGSSPSTDDIAGLDREAGAGAATAARGSEGRTAAAEDRSGEPGDQQLAAPPPVGATDDGSAAGAGAAADGDDDADVRLLSEAEGGRLRDAWQQVQASFVDDPRSATQRADALVVEVMQALAAGFAQHKGTLEEQWRSGDDVGTEELRVAVRRYRVFFDRLLQA